MEPTMRSSTRIITRRRAMGQIIACATMPWFIVKANAQRSLDRARLSAFTSGPPPAAGGGNNAALVGTNFTGVGDGTNPTSRALSLPSNVTSGNVVIFGGFIYGVDPLSAGMLTKTAGTSTVGTITMDSTLFSAGDNVASVIYRVPITGTGSLTLTWNYVEVAFSGAGVAEFTGLNASPLDSGGTGSNSGTTGGSPFTETSGTITTVGKGLIVSMIGEGNASGDWTRTNSGTVIKGDQTGTSNFTFVMQFLINSTTSNAITSTAQGTGITFVEAHAAYKTS